MAPTCALGSLLRPCTNDTVATCVYCGHPFCRRHGARLADHQDVCSRRHCQAKLADLEAHFHYRAGVSERNGGGLCGLQGCGHSPAGQCSKCRGYFCDQHIRHRSEEVRRGRQRFQRSVSTCDHCWRRRPLWERV